MIAKTVSHYKILEKLGEGGMGVVYKALDTKLDRHVAIKFLPHRLQSDPDTKKRFIREAKAASALEHPNICAVHEIGETSDGDTYMVMPSYDGRSLQDRIKDGPVSVEDAIDLVAQIAAGLAKAHKGGIVHRDIKPGNIFVTKDGHAKILDFGLAKLAGQTKLTKTGTTVGTVAYMSPEQVNGHEVDHRSDIYSLGVVLYELLTGNLPFHGDHEAAVLYGIVHNDPESIASYRSDVPSGLRRVVDVAMDKDPASRYQTAADIQAALDAVRADLRSRGLGEDSGPWRSTADLSRGSYRVRRKIITRWAVAGIAGALFVALGYMGYAEFWRSGEGSPPAEQPPGAAVPTHDFVVATAPFWGPTDGALEEGRVMQALIGRDIRKLLDQEGEIEILGVDIAKAPRTHEQAQDLGDSLGASMVIWGEVLVLHGEVEIQPYITLDESMTRQYDPSLSPLEANLADPNQLNLRKGKAEEMGSAALIVVAAFYRGNDPDKGLSLLRKEPSLSAENLRWQGMILRDMRKWEEAKGCFDRAIELEPHNVNAILGLGITYYLQGKSDLAEGAFQKAVDVDPTNPEAYWWLGYTYKNALKYGEAIDAFEQVIALDPDYEDAYEDISHSYRQTGRFEEAAEPLERLLRRNPKSATAHMGLGWVYRWKGDYDRAAAEFREALVAAPDWPPAVSGLAGVYAARGESERAIAMYKKVHELDPDMIWGHNDLGFLYVDLSRYDEAITEFEIARKIDPNVINPINGLFTCYLRTGAADKAVTLLEGLVETHPTASIIARLAVAHGILGDIDETVAVLERAVQLHSQDIFLQVNRLLWLYRAGRPLEAQSIFAIYAEGLADHSHHFSFIARYLAGEISEQALFDAMKVDDGTVGTKDPKYVTPEMRRLGKAYYYVGLGHLIGVTEARTSAPADTARAIDCFEKSVETASIADWEYDLAMAELKRLGRR